MQWTLNSKLIYEANTSMMQLSKLDVVDLNVEKEICK